MSIITPAGSEIFLCESVLSSGTLWYQSESEEATSYTEMHIPHSGNPNSTVMAAVFTVTPIIMVWESSDLVSHTAPETGITSLTSTSTVITIFNPQPTVYTEDESTDDNGSSLSNGAVAAISTSAALAVILLVATFLFYRAWRRRRSAETSKPEVNSGETPGAPRTNEEIKAEMEDPVSARELFKQSGLYRGKPELGTEVDELKQSNPGEADMIKPTDTRDIVAEHSLSGNRNAHELRHADPVELE